MKIIIIYSLPVSIISPNIDFVINTPTISNSTTIVGQYYYVTCNLYNLGNTFAGPNYVGYYLSSDSILDLSDTFISSSSVYQLYGNSSTSVSSYFAMPYVVTGKYYLLCVADYLNTIKETNESNNVASLPISVYQSTFTDVTLKNTVWVYCFGGWRWPKCYGLRKHF